VTALEQATHIEVDARVRYWEDATVDGREDTDGSLIPFRVSDSWCPKIRLADGLVEGWPVGTTADVHYKVCDDGDYWLASEGRRIAKWAGHYVPDEFLCHGDDAEGFGDYIILRVNAAGRVEGWLPPRIEADSWVSLDDTEPKR
jgi:hypothetical protein